MIFSVLKTKIKTKIALIDQSAKFYIFFVELGGGVGDVPFWCHDGAYVEFGFR